MDTLQNNIKRLLLDYENFTHDQIDFLNHALESILLTDDQKDIIGKCKLLGIRARWIEHNIIDFSLIYTPYMTYRYDKGKYFKIDEFIKDVYYPECEFDKQLPMTEEQVLEDIKRLLE